MTASGTHAGGVAAYICDGTSMKSCFSYGTVTGKSGVGGIVGLCYSAAYTITGCANFGPVTGSGSGSYGTGGIAGRLAGVMTQCANYGPVSGADRYTGGLAGYTTARNKTKILACKNEASVSSANTDARVSTGSIVGNAQNLIWGGCTAADSELPMLGRSGKVAAQETKDICPDYAPTGRDMTITAIYRQNLVSGGNITKSGIYFIPWLASGEIRIADSLDVTLIGLDSGSGEFDNLMLTVGKGTKLTLQDVRITGDETLLSLAGGNTLTLLGENRLIGCADASGNACPTVISGGDLTICGSGSLKLQALVNNAAFMGAETSKISIENCLISVFKSDKLGFDGGAFCANGADLTMTNATFFGRTDSDTVAVLSADTIAMTDCTVRVEAEKSVHAVAWQRIHCGLQSLCLRPQRQQREDRFADRRA